MRWEILLGLCNPVWWGFVAHALLIIWQHTVMSGLASLCHTNEYLANSITCGTNMTSSIPRRNTVTVITFRLHWLASVLLVPFFLSFYFYLFIYSFLSFFLQLNFISVVFLLQSLALFLNFIVFFIYPTFVCIVPLCWRVHFPMLCQLSSRLHWLSSIV